MRRGAAPGLALASLFLASGCVMGEAGGGLAVLNVLSWLVPPKPAAEAEARATPPPATPLFCYRTLADRDCHAEPLPAGEDTRLVGIVARRAD